MRNYTEYKKALRNKELIPADKCENCLESGKIDGHHPDYNYMLNVVWLCAKCHATVQNCSQFVDDYKLRNFNERTSNELSVEEKSNLHKKMGFNKFRHVPIEEQCSVEELDKLREYDEKWKYHYRIQFESKEMAQFYYDCKENLEKDLREKYPKIVEKLY